MTFGGPAFIFFVPFAVVGVVAAAAAGQKWLAGTRHTVRLILLFRSFFLLLLGCCYQSMFQAGCVSELVWSGGGGCGGDGCFLIFYFFFFNSWF